MIDKIIKRKIFTLLTGQFETYEFHEYYLDMCEQIPDYVFTMPASTSGKYHNASQCQPHGQLYHIFMFHSILEHLLSLEGNRKRFPTPEERDAMRCVPAFHDAVKCGWNGSLHTVQNHPLLAAEWVRSTKTENFVDPKYVEMIARMCEAHSGEWNKNKAGIEIMSKPRDDRELLIHECDILASRADIDWVISEDLKTILGNVDTNSQPSPEDFVLSFGKHKGKTLGEVYDMFPNYVEWLAENFDRDPLRSMARELVGK